MIKNERQYRLARSERERFKGALDGLRTEPSPQGDQLRRSLEIGAVEAQVSELDGQIREYEELKAGKAGPLRLGSLAELPALLIRARIASGLTQRDLAEKLGMKEQQLQRYEADDWATASLSRLAQVAEAVGIEIGQSIEGSQGIDTLVTSLEAAGVDAAFIRRRLVPFTAADATTDTGGAALLDFASRAGRVFGWSPSDMMDANRIAELEPLELAASFKLPQKASAPRVRSYAAYSRYLALLLIRASASKEEQPIPATAEAFRNAVLGAAGKIDFGSVLSFVWDLGVPVLPLADPGGFHAALWRVQGRSVIVLKQAARVESRWLFDLLHEVRHAIESVAEENYTVLDLDDEPSDRENVAHRFAGDVLLGGRAEELAQQCVETAAGSVEHLKSAVVRVAAKEKVRTDDLANYMAHRLSQQEINWWGAATNLQQTGLDPWSLARDELFARTQLDALSDLDRGLLSQALSLT